MVSRLPWRRRSVASERLVFGVTAAVWKFDGFWKLSRSGGTLVNTLVLWWWLWIDARFTDSDASWKSGLHEVPPTFQWSISVVSVVRMRVIPVTLTSWASVFSALCIRIPALPTDTSVLDVVASPTSLAGDASDLFVRKSWELTLASRLPVFALHKTRNAPRLSAGWPNTGSVGFLSCEGRMIAIALFCKSAALQTLEVLQ